ELARTAPAAESAPEVAADRALAGRASELADEVSRRSAALGAASARLDATEDLATKVGSGAVCPFLAVACPHPRGKNLLETVRETSVRERLAVAAARDALRAAEAQQKLARAAQERIERLHEAHKTWLARVVQTAPTCVSWLEAFDQERAALTAAVAETAGPLRELVTPLRGDGRAAHAASAHAPVIGQGRLFEAPAPSSHGFSVPATWSAESLRDLARVLRARRTELEAVSWRTLDEALAAHAARVAAESADLDARLRAAALRREKVHALLEAAPGRLAELGERLARLRAEQAALAERHAQDALLRAAEVAARRTAYAAIEQVPEEHERFVRALETARRADAEATRLRVLAEQAPPARERLERVRARASELDARARALAAELRAALGRPGDGGATSGGAASPELS